MTFINLEFGDLRFRAWVLSERSPNSVAAFLSALPIEGTAVHGIWSGAVFRMLEPAPIHPDQRDARAPFQHPGLVVLNPGNNELAICYGQGRLNQPSGPQTPVPIAEIEGELEQLVELAKNLQFSGAKPIRFSVSEDQESAFVYPDSPAGRTFEVTFGETRLTATLLESQTPVTSSAFAAQLPLTGIGSNTHSSGTLVRFWNEDGGPEGETPLDINQDEPSQAILYPGYMYYLPNEPWRGIRIPYEATAMGSSLVRGTTRLIPVAKFDGDYSAFIDTARKMVVEGAKPLAFHLRES